MQLYAYNQKNQAIFASKANKGINYFCIECKQVVRLRLSVQKRAHFYHLSPNKNCRHFGKSMEHLQTQWHIYSLLPEGECKLEHYFPSSNRIADVLWEKNKIVFEIQCSYISSGEIEARNKDYQKEGLQVIWILHDRHFNRWKVSSAEHYLQHLPKYFTNINQNGIGFIYDQIENIEKGRRRKKSLKFPICINEIFSIKRIDELCLNQYPKLIQKRMQGWSFYFKDDLLSRVFTSKEFLTFISATIDNYNATKNRQEGRFPVIRFLHRFLISLVVRPYHVLLQIFLEKTVR